MRVIDILKENIKVNFKEVALEIIPLPNSGSHRQYFRILLKNRSIIGVFNENIKENTAFIEFAKHFKQRGLNVPAVLAYNLNEHIYFIEDLGDEILFLKVIKEQKEGRFSKELISIYKNVIDELIRFQIEGNKGLNYSFCYPIKEFNKNSIQWDLNFFKYI